jgi:EAL domain-containing protein (putative c-di-GMP-specific phosphodiesterase class I)
VGAVRWDHPDRGLIPAHELRSALGAGATTLPIVHWCIDRAITDVRTVAPVRAEHVSVWLSMPGRAALAASTRDAIVSAISGPDGTLTTDSAPSLVLDVHEVDVASLTRRQALHRHLDDLLEVGPLALGVEHFTADMVPVGMLQLLSAASVSLDPDLLASVGENRSTEELVRALVAAASALGVITVAMHVDSPEQLAIARSLGIHAAYGDLVGPAAPLDTYADLLQDGRMELPGAPVDTAADADDEVETPGVELGDNVPTDLALSPGPDEGPSDADIWAGVLGRRRHELVSDGTTTGPEPVLPPEQATTPGAEPVVLPPSPSLWPTVEAAVEPVVAARDAVEPQQDPVSTVSIEPVVVDLRDLVVHAPAPPEPQRPLATTPAPTTAPDSIGDAVARELGFDLPPAPSPPPPLIGEIVARELGVELAPDRAPTSGSIAEQVAYDMGLRLPTVTPPVAVVEPAAGYWEHELDTDY